MTSADGSAGPTFDDLDLDARLRATLTELAFDTPTPIQAEAIPPMLAGRDVIGRARTGSGKTAAFGLPLLQRLLREEPGKGRPVRALVLAPTRELALQVTGAIRSFAKDTPLRLVTIYGGASYGPQLRALGSGVPIVVGTPGRVLDHLERGTLDLSQLEMLVLDEADEMLRMGFVEDVERVLAASPDKRQVALFSATMPPAIRKIANKHLNNPLEVQVESEALSASHVRQRWLLVPEKFKRNALLRVLAAEPQHATLVFARTRASCAEVAEGLAKRGIAADALHGDLAQGARERVLNRLRSGQLRVVVATDVASRGIDVENLDHVVNLDLPMDTETYVHRIGRTARAGREGWATSFVTPRETGKIRRMQRTLGVSIEPYTVPSDADIIEAKKQRLATAVVEALQPTSAGAFELVDALKEHGTERELLAGALRLLSDQFRLDLDAEPDQEPPAWSKERAQSRDRDRGPKRDRPERGGDRPRGRDRIDTGEWTDVFVPIGRSRGVRPGDLVGAITGDAGLQGSQIGRVTIHDHVSFVQVDADAADGLLSRGRRIVVRGKKVEISKARPSEDSPHGPPGGKGPKRKGKGKSGGPGGRKPPKRKQSR